MGGGGLLGGLFGLLRGLRILGGLTAGGSTARRVAFGLAVFGLWAYAGGAEPGSILGTVAFLVLVGYVGARIVRTAQRLIGRG